MKLWLVIGLWCVGISMAVTLLMALLRSGHPIRGLLGSTIQGACALAAVNVTAMFTGVSLGVNVFSALSCMLLGVPGVIALLLLRLIFSL